MNNMNSKSTASKSQFKIISVFKKKTIQSELKCRIDQNLSQNHENYSTNW